MSLNNFHKFSNKNNFKKIFQLTFARKIFLYYIFFILIGTMFLALPISWKHGNTNVTFINALFDASSAFSDTGLSNFASTFDTYNVFGQIVIFLLIFIGGLGFNAIKLIVFFFILRKLRILDRLFMGYEKGINNVKNTKSIIITSIWVVIIFEVIFGFALAFYFNFSSNIILEINYFNAHVSDSSYVNPYFLHYHFGNSLWYGFFHANSAINNAGFDILGNHSLSPFVNDYYIQTIFILLIVIGGIGFPIYYEIFQKIIAIKKGEMFKFSLFTKITVITYFAMMIFSTGLVVILEATAQQDTSLSKNPMIFQNPEYDSFEKFMICFFTEISSRSAGFSTINIQDFNAGSKAIYLFNMWVGASPSSSGGGIRTTTFGIVLIAIFCFMFGKKEVFLFKKNLSNNLIKHASVVFIMGIFLIFIASIFVIPTLWKLNTNPNHVYTYTFIDVMFECTSAFGTTGLSTGISSSGNLSIFAKLILIALMIIGQLTISSTLLLGSNTNKAKKSNLYYPEEDIAIG